MQFCTTLSPCYEVIQWHHTYRDTLYKQGQLGVTIIDTIGTAVSGSLLLFHYAAKVTLKDGYISPECLSTLHWLPIYYRCVNKLVTIIYKTLQKNESQYLANNLYITAVERMIKYNKSNTKLSQVPFNKKKTQGDRGISFTGPNYWNKLLNFIKEAENLWKLKQNLSNTFFSLLCKFSFH